MKNFRIVLVVLLMAFVLPIFAQPTESEFLGKWDLMVRDLPDGDAEMHLIYI